MSEPLHLHLEPVMYVCRGYADPDGFAKQHAYELVLNVFMLGDGRARVFGTHGALNRATVDQLAAKLGALGVKTVLVARHGVEHEWEINRATGTHRRESR